MHCFSDVKLELGNIKQKNPENSKNLTLDPFILFTILV